MKTPAIPANEAERLASLRESGLPDTDDSARYDRFTRLARRLFNVSAAMVNVVDAQSLVVKSAIGKTPEALARDISFCGHTILGENALVVTDTHNDERFADNPLVTGTPGVRFYAGVPLRLPNGTVAGALSLIDSEPRTFSKDDIAALQDLASLVEDSFATTAAATTDAFTGLLNRRGLSNLASYAISTARRRAEPLTIAWLSLDSFKTINERWGSAEGDAALKAMSQLLKTTFREMDVLARIRGDEFAILFADTDEKGAWIAMQYLAEQTKSHNQTASHPWKLAFSWGVSEFNHDKDSLQSWITKVVQSDVVDKRNEK